MKLNALLCTCALLAVGAATAGAASAADPETTHQWLNQQRLANGIPAVDTYDAAATDGCRKHINYMSVNGGGLTHDEVPGSPGYTPEGAYAGARSVLAEGSAWSPTDNPWSDAPLHLLNLFSPNAVAGGGAEEGKYTCYSHTQVRQFASPTFFSYPGNGVGGVATSSQVLNEGPFAPQDLVGLQGAETGPNQEVWLLGTDGSDPHILDASTVGPAGPVETRHVDTQTPRAAGYVRQAGVIIPVAPLAPFTTYRTNVLWATADGQTIPTSFSFETRGRASELDFSIKKGKGSIEAVMLTNAGGPVATIRRGGGPVKPLPIRRDPRNGEPTYLAKASGLAAGTYTVCGQVGSRASGFELKSECATTAVPAYTKLSLAKRLSRGRKAKLSVSGLARGRKAVVRMARYKRRCYANGGCRMAKSGKTRKRTVKLRRKTVALRVPRASKRGRVKVSVSLKSFRHRGVRVAGTSTSRTYR